MNVVRNSKNSLLSHVKPPSQQTIGIREVPIPIPTPHSTGLTHISLTVDDLDVTHQKLAAAGVVFFAPPQRSPDGYAKVTYGRGPEGVLLELVEVLQS